MARLPHLQSLLTAATLAVALGGPSLFVVLSELVFGESRTLGTHILLQLVYCGLAGVVLWIALCVERLPPEAIGLRRPRWSTFISAALLLLFLVFVFPILTTPLVSALGPDGLQSGLDRLAALPPWLLVIVGITGGAVEETLYRGYAIERLSAITGQRWLAGAISAIAFGLAHLPSWGVGLALGVDLPFGIVMTLFYLWRRDLLANILAHVGALIVSMLTFVP